MIPKRITMEIQLVINFKSHNGLYHSYFLGQLSCDLVTKIKKAVTQSACDCVVVCVSYTVIYTTHT